MRATIISNMREGLDVKIVKGRTIVVNCREEPVAASAFYPWPRARATRAIRRSRGSARGQAGYRSASAPAAPPVGLLLDEESRLCRGRRRFAAFVSISSSRDIAQGLPGFQRFDSLAVEASGVFHKRGQPGTKTSVLRRGTESSQTRRWRKTDSNSRSHRERNGYGKPFQEVIAVSDLNPVVERRCSLTGLPTERADWDRFRPRSSKG